MTPRASVAALGLLALAGCGLPLPYPPERLAADAAHIPAKALVHYLGQPDPLRLAVCDPTATGPHLPAVDTDLVDKVTRAFLAGKVPAAHWSGCLVAMWHGGPPEVQDHLAGVAILAFRQVLDTRGLPTNERLVRLGAVAGLVERRPPGTRLPETAATATLATIDARRAELEPEVAAMADRFEAEVGLDLGLWQGERVDAARIDATTDEALLKRFATRLPDPALQRAARARIVRLRIAKSPREVVRAHAEEVVAAVLKTGHWTIPLDQFPVQSVDVGTGPKGAVTWLVVQDPHARTAGLRARLGDGTLLDALPLARRLHVHLQRMQSAVGPCTEDDGLDPEPCVAPDAIAVDHPLLKLDAEGRLVTPVTLPPATVASLARLSELVVPLAVGGQHAELTRPLHFAPPEPLVLQGPVGSKGPALVVRVRPEGPDRLVYAIQDGPTRYQVVVEHEDLGRFRVVSQGGRGVAGTRGRDGSPGRPGEDGMDAFCPNSYGDNGQMGGGGGDGQNGGAGGRGGDGGDVQVYLKCADQAACAGLLDLVEPTVHSVGGPGGKGGPGGRGGAGGEGGRGGQGMGCVVGGISSYLQGGHDGLRGLDGQPGKPGPGGPDGGPGSGRVQVVP